MALIEVKDAEVIKLIDGYGCVVAESYKTKDGETRKSYYTVWTKDSVRVGDLVNVKGVLSVKLDEYEKNGETTRRASANINNPVIQKVDVEF